MHLMDIAGYCWRAQHRKDQDMYIDGIACCGVGEIDGLSGYDSTQDALEALFRDNGIPRQPFVIFTQATSQRRESYGDRFKAYLEAEGLGEVSVSGYKANPNSGNFVKVFVWTVNRKAVDKLYAAFTKAEAMDRRL